MPFKTYPDFKTIQPGAVEGKIKEVGPLQSFGANNTTFGFSIVDALGTAIRVSCYNDRARALRPMMKAGQQVRLEVFHIRAASEYAPVTGHPCELSMTRDSVLTLQ